MAEDHNESTYIGDHSESIVLVLRALLPERAMDPQREKPITFVLVLNESRPTVHHEPLVEAPKLLDHTNRDNDRLLRLLVTVGELVAGWDRPAAAQIPPQWPLDDIKTVVYRLGFVMGLARRI